MGRTIRVAILDDHQTIIDGYLSRLSPEPDIEILACARYGDQLRSIIAEYEPDLVILDVNVPTSPTNDNPYPILHDMRWALAQFPRLTLLVISMHAGRSLVKAVLAAGAGGYILKEDYQSLVNLASIVRMVAGGGICLSRKVQQYVTQQTNEREPLTPRQQELLSLLVAHPSMTSSELARRLGITASTVRNLLSTTYARLEVVNKTEAILKAKRLGLVTSDLPDLTAADFG